MDNGGRVCDGNGLCIACNSPTDCASNVTQGCLGGVYTAPPTCNGGMCTPGAITNCAATMLVCKSTGCMHCTLDTDCGPQISGCSVNKCTNGVCQATTVPQGSGCTNPVGAGACNANGTCILAKYVFVTSTDVAPSFGGTAGADSTCVKIAEMATLGGTWLSWTSDSQSSPSTRFTQVTGAPYRLLDDTIVANNWTELTSGTLQHAINLGENRASVPLAEVWTGTAVNGTYATASCGDWASPTGAMEGAIVGASSLANGYWTNAKSDLCTVKAHLYCFQQ
jgi:hypothetical protein